MVNMSEEYGGFMLQTSSRSQADLASVRTRYHQGDGMLRMISLIYRFFLYQLNILERLQKAHDSIRSFQESKFLCQ